MTVALIFTPDGNCRCNPTFDEYLLTTMIFERATSQLSDYFTEQLDTAIKQELGQDAYQKILDLVGRKPIWNRMVYDKMMVYPCQNILIHDILQNIYGDVGQIFGYVILLE